MNQSTENRLSVINGSESGDYDARFNAVIQFYQAFNQRNLALMQANWLNSPEASMCNPLGGLKRGWEAIESVYQRIFNGKARVFVEYYDFELIGSENCFVIVGRERGELQLAQQKLALKIRTSRVFQLTDNAWKQVHHHGSMDDPALLLQYQTLLA